MESIIPKRTKYLELGESKIAFHGVLLPLFLFFIILISGCSWFADKRIRVEPEVDFTSPKYQKILTIMLNKRYESDFFKCLAADAAHREYLSSRKQPTADMKKFIDKLDIIVQKAKESLSVHSVELASQEYLIEETAVANPK